MKNKSRKELLPNGRPAPGEQLPEEEREETPGSVVTFEKRLHRQAFFVMISRLWHDSVEAKDCYAGE